MTKQYSNKKWASVVYRKLWWGDGLTLKNFNIVLAIKNLLIQGFSGGAVVKNPPANAGDMGSGPGRSHMPRSN